VRPETNPSRRREDHGDIDVAGAEYLSLLSSFEIKRFYPARGTAVPRRPVAPKPSLPRI